MSARWTEWAWRQNLRPKSKLLLLAIADQMSDTGVAVLDLQDLAQRAGLKSTVEVHRVLKGVVGGSAERKGDNKMVVRLDAESALAESARAKPASSLVSSSDAESASESAKAKSARENTDESGGGQPPLEETLRKEISDWRRGR